MSYPAASDLFFSVNLWQSHPDADNDDCLTGFDFETAVEALNFVDQLGNGIFPAWLTMRTMRTIEWIEIAYTGSAFGIEKRPGLFVNPHFAGRKVLDAEDRADSAYDRHEAAMLAGMAGGCDAYNDVMGWGE